MPEIEARIIAIDDEPLPTLAAARVLPAGEIGEIIVRGPVVTKAYDLLPEATARAKIYEVGAAAPAPPEPASAPTGLACSTAAP